ncbi:GumC family protein [Mucilaginibacter lappiensis]|uniref:non-specific protein-tyrosine kinase n=1 Tax=Mucilaginibacter lappiensis TaxID=354630 RepID=A0A841JHZ0_9SPHI|nr:polysaccharide biosynthesis tyrosine autokinase [Mucilaginibacter lappiensis]MBB6130783.1 capsular exopolysaccharide synthesis family protein [Mucilaginibacter lappiensis]
MDSFVDKSYRIGENEDKSVHLMDLLKYLLFHWKWFVLSIMLFGGYFYFQYSKTPFVYSRSETVMIKTSTNTISVSRITRPNNFYNTVNVNSEILQLRSKELMRNTVRLIHADMSYVTRDGLRKNELYTNSPFKVEPINSNSKAGFTFTIISKNNKQVELSGFSVGNPAKTMMVNLNEQVNTPVGTLLISPTPNYRREMLGKPIVVTKNPLEAMVGYFLGNLTITQMEDAAILQISMEDSSPSRAGDLIMKLIEVYNGMTINDKNRIGVSTAEFIKKRLSIIEQDLGSVESNLESMKVANQGLDIKSASDAYWTDSRQYQSSGKDLETQLSLIEIMRQRLIDKDKELIPSNTGMVDNSIESQITEYNSLLLKRNRLLEGNNSANPVVKDLNVVLAAMHQNIMRAVDNEITGLKVKIRNIGQEKQQAINKAQGLPAKQRMMLSEERQQKVKEDLYILLLNKREENELNLAMTDDNIRIIDPASGTDFPIYPNKFRKMMVGIGIGLALPTVTLLLVLLLNTGVHSRKDLEDQLSAPFLGEIPFSSDIRKSQTGIVVHEQGIDEVTEAFRIIRTNLDFMTPGEKKQQVLTFTSFNVGAGKTFSVINLGMSLKFLNKRVVLLDLDLRKGTLSNRTKVPMPVGISHFLSDTNVSIDQIIYKDRIAEHIDIVPIGVIATNPVELLLSERLDILVNTLKERYDYIVVDGVPFGIVADSSIVNRISDTTIFVIRAGKLDRRQLPGLEKIYRKNTFTNLSLVLNGVRLNQGRYGYANGYGYAKGYGYGYAIKKLSLFSRLKSKLFS